VAWLFTTSNVETLSRCRDDSRLQLTAQQEVGASYGELRKATSVPCFVQYSLDLPLDIAMELADLVLVVALKVDVKSPNSDATPLC